MWTLSQHDRNLTLWVLAQDRRNDILFEEEALLNPLQQIKRVIFRRLRYHTVASLVRTLGQLVDKVT